MFQPKIVSDRQIQACLNPANAIRFARGRDAIINDLTKLRQILVRIDGAILRNPSPWRRSGANLHPLPPFFLSAVEKPNFERDLLCQNQQFEMALREENIKDRQEMSSIRLCRTLQKVTTFC